MGQKSSRLEKALASSSQIPDTENYLGLENFGNTCYFNSVVQALYFCQPFREAVLAHRSSSSSKGSEDEDNLLLSLSDLFHTFASSRKKTGVISPKRFFNRLRKDNELFNSTMQQDAQEFLNFLLNHIAEIMSPPRASTRDGERPKTWVHDIFEGTLVNETRCLTCETVRTREESFLDLSVDIEPNSSISSCLRNFSSVETLADDSKYYCETCCSNQEATKRMLVKKLPNVLALHLKRFKYSERVQRFMKLSCRVVHPFELRLFNTTDDSTECEREYTLTAVVVHIGSQPSRGHYISLVKSGGKWIEYDDDLVDLLDEEDMGRYFGLTDYQQDHVKTSETAYILFYTAKDSAASLPRKSSKDGKDKDHHPHPLTAQHTAREKDRISQSSKDAFVANGHSNGHTNGHTNGYANGHGHVYGDMV